MGRLTKALSAIDWPSNLYEGHWLWTGSVMPEGYGQYWAEGRNRLPHRVTYESLIGEIPPAKEMDHLCRVRHCVNPWHLEPVSHRENVLRGVAPAASMSRREFCIRGHRMETQKSRPPLRFCRICKRVTNERSRKKRRKEKRLAKPNP